MANQINVFTGCMGSGKTERLIYEIINQRQRSKTFLALKPAIDNTDITSRNKELPTIGSLSFKNYEDLRKIFLNEKVVDCLFFDETSLLVDSSFLVDALIEARSLGYKIWLTSLNHWWTGETPDILKRLKKYPDIINIFKIPSKVRCVVCGHKATFTFKKGGGDDLIEVGHYQYEPRCRKHFSQGMQNRGKR